MRIYKEYKRMSPKAKFEKSKRAYMIYVITGGADYEDKRTLQVIDEAFESDFKDSSDQLKSFVEAIQKGFGPRVARVAHLRYRGRLFMVSYVPDSSRMDEKRIYRGCVPEIANNLLPIE